MLEFPGPEVFEAVVDRIETGVYVVDGKQRVVYWNHGAEKITGLRAQEMLGGPCASNLGLEELGHNPANCLHQCPMERATREPRHDVTVNMRHRAGHLLRVRLWTMAVRNAAGEIAGAVKVFTDRANAPAVNAEKRKNHGDRAVHVQGWRGRGCRGRQKVRASERIRGSEKWRGGKA